MLSIYILISSDSASNAKKKLELEYNEKLWLKVGNPDIPGWGNIRDSGDNV